MFMIPPPFWFGDGIKSNFDSHLKQLPFFRNMFNSAAVATLATLTTVFFCTMAGFAFAKYRFKGKKAAFNFILITLAIPQLLGIIPFFKMMVWFRWLNTWFPLFIPTMASAFGIFLMRQYLEGSIPVDLLDAARIDGMGEFFILLRIVFPLAKPAIAVLGMSTFIGSWNNFFGAPGGSPKKGSLHNPCCPIKPQGGHPMKLNRQKMAPSRIFFLFFYLSINGTASVR